MKKLLIIILIAFCTNLSFGQSELSDKQRIEILEAKIQQLELLMSELQKRIEPKKVLKESKKISKYTPITVDGEIIEYSKFDELKNKMTKAEVLEILGEPVDIKKTQQIGTKYEDWIYNKALSNGRSSVKFKNGYYFFNRRI